MQRNTKGETVNNYIIDIEPLISEIDLSSFNCGINSINTLLRDAYYKQVMKLASSNKILFNNKPVGYFIVSMTEIDSDEIKYWAINLEVICIDESYQGYHIGTNVLGYIVEQSREVSGFVGCRYLVLDAIKHRAEWYEKRGFSFFNPSDVADENTTVKMFIDFQDELLVNEFFEI